MIHLSTAARNAGLDARFDLVDAGSGPGIVTVYQGYRGYTADDPPQFSDVVLAIFTLESPAFAPAVNGVKTLNLGAGLDTTALADGFAGYARVTDSDDQVIFNGTIGTAGTDFIINVVQLQTGQPVHLLLGEITDPASP